MRTIELQRWLMLSASLAFALSRSDNDLFDPLNSLKLLLRNGGRNIFTVDRLVDSLFICSCEGTRCLLALYVYFDLVGAFISIFVRIQLLFLMKLYVRVRLP